MKILKGYVLNKDILDKKGNSPRIFTVQQFIVWKFLKNPAYTDWIREASIADKIISLYPDVNFWNFFHLDFKLNSVAWFLTFDGKTLLQKEKHKFDFMNKEKISNKTFALQQEKIGTDISLPEKPKTLFDFLKK